jgi:hypothetical protein
VETYIIIGNQLQVFIHKIITWASSSSLSVVIFIKFPYQERPFFSTTLAVCLECAHSHHQFKLSLTPTTDAFTLNARGKPMVCCGHKVPINTSRNLVTQVKQLKAIPSLEKSGLLQPKQLTNVLLNLVKWGCEEWLISPRGAPRSPVPAHISYSFLERVNLTSAWWVLVDHCLLVPTRGAKGSISRNSPSSLAPGRCHWCNRSMQEQEEHERRQGMMSHL